MSWETKVEGDISEENDNCDAVFVIVVVVEEEEEEEEVDDVDDNIEDGDNGGVCDGDGMVGIE